MNADVAELIFCNTEKNLLRILDSIGWIVCMELIFNLEPPHENVGMYIAVFKVVKFTIINFFDESGCLVLHFPF